KGGREGKECTYKWRLLEQKASKIRSWVGRTDEVLKRNSPATRRMLVVVTPNPPDLTLLYPTLYSQL
ncbi:hypothetical protein XELAEV_18032318mg, partial [Xenopus laevis]